MSDQSVTRNAGVPEMNQKKDARDLLAHLYREIGISAVAAALSVSAVKDSEPEAVAVYASGMLAAKNAA